MDSAIEDVKHSASAAVHTPAFERQLSSCSTLANSSTSGSSSHGPVFPPSHPARTLVLCFDGTGDQFDSDNSNVVKFFSLLKKDDRNEQMVYYQPGIGTYISNTQNVDGIKAKVDKLLDAMVAWNLSAHVMGGYEFIMQNYQAGDKISVFGFSRGAYTARALAGMIHKVGLLPVCNHQQVPFAYSMYARDDKQGWEDSKLFKKSFSIDVSIDFIGVWDTVNSVGLVPHTLPFTRSNNRIRVFRQALALDERRVRFKPALYRSANSKKDVELETQPRDMPHHDTILALSDWFRSANLKSAVPKREGGRGRQQRAFEQQFCTEDEDNGDCHRGQTDALEVWFAGGHCDVGGGNTPNHEPHSLARIPLRWMIRECFKANTGIRFHGRLLQDVGLDPATLYPRVLERPPALKPEITHLTTVAGLGASEEEHEVRDAQMERFDQLAKAPFWWALECLPSRREISLKWKAPNMGRPRKVPSKKGTLPFYVHRSVKIRTESPHLKRDKPYRPVATCLSKVTFVD